MVLKGSRHLASLPSRRTYVLMPIMATRSAKSPELPKLSIGMREGTKPMTQRSLFLAAYDVADPRRLKLSLELIKGHATGGQKSAYECYLNDTEKYRLLHDICLVLNEEADSFLLIGLDPRSRVFTLGRAVEPADPEHFYLG